MLGNRYFDELKCLKWCEAEGVGYYPVTDHVYDAEYIEKYEKMAQTEMGEALTASRLEIVEKYVHTGSVVDIGVGAGQFMDAAGCLGFDINQKAVRELIKAGTFINPYNVLINHATFWDSLEHIHDIAEILANIDGYIFVSLPIFKSLEHVQKSRHFRPDEHCWYFTNEGFQKFIVAHGFNVVEYSDIETELGREDIGLFVCKRSSK